jgi:hypothetical protein
MSWTTDRCSRTPTLRDGRIPSGTVTALAVAATAVAALAGDGCKERGRTAPLRASMALEALAKLELERVRAARRPSAVSRPQLAGPRQRERGGADRRASPWAAGGVARRHGASRPATRRTPEMRSTPARCSCGPRLPPRPVASALLRRAAIAGHRVAVRQAPGLPRRADCPLNRPHLRALSLPARRRSAGASRQSDRGTLPSLVARARFTAATGCIRGLRCPPGEGATRRGAGVCLARRCPGTRRRGVLQHQRAIATIADLQEPTRGGLPECRMIVDEQSRSNSRRAAPDVASEVNACSRAQIRLRRTCQSFELGHPSRAQAPQLDDHAGRNLCPLERDPGSQSPV